MILNTKTSAAWQKRRSDFNHDWMQNHFIVTLSDWSKSIQKSRWNNCTLQLFEHEVVDAWENSNKELITLVSDYKKFMSPRVIIQEKMNMSPGWQQILGVMIHSLWMVRYDVQARTEKVLVTYSDAKKVYESLRKNFAEVLAMQDSEKLMHMFDDFKSCCLRLRNAISLLESSIKIT